jgi:transcriptional regulator with XRE-family HTH domain
MTNESDFVEWLEGELRTRDWKQADLVRRSGISSGLLSLILSRQRKPGPDTCKAIAHAFGMKEIQVLRIAGIAPDAEPDKFSPIIEATAAMLKDLSEEDQDEIRAMVRVKWERRRRRVTQGAK